MKNYVSRKAAPVLYGGGAAATIAVSAPFAKKYASAFQDIPWRELTSYAQWPFAAMGAGLGLLATNDVTETRKRGIRPHTLEYIGAALQYAPAVAPLLSSITDENAIYSMVVTGAAAVAGFCAKGIGAGIRKNRRNINMRDIDINYVFNDDLTTLLKPEQKRKIVADYLPDEDLCEIARINREHNL